MLNRLALAVALSLHAAAARSIPTTVYVWQTQDSPELADAVNWGCATFAGLNTLTAEATWTGSTVALRPSGVPNARFATCGRPRGMSFRLGELRGSLAERQAALTALTAAICRSATAAATPAPAEVQIDFDAHVSQLPAFKHWLEDLHRCLPAIPLTFTALPSWLASPAFVELARAFPNYVLQLHWLQGSGAQRMLYDSAAAHRAVAAAAQLGVAFRIALPAYRYLAAFDATGELIGLEAERGARRYPPGSELSVVTVDWAQLAADVRGWTAAPPRGLAGIAWFRLPLTTDENSLSRADLGRIMQGLAPAGASGFEVTLRRKQPGLFDVVLRNRGHDPALLSADWRIAWRGPGRLVAWDGFAPFRAEADPASELVLRRTTTSHRDVLAPGEERLIGWLRFVPNNKEVTPYVRAN